MSEEGCTGGYREAKARARLCQCGHDVDDHLTEKSCNGYDAGAWDAQACYCVGFRARTLDWENAQRYARNIPVVGDVVWVTKNDKIWKTRVVRFDDFGMYWCATWRQSLVGHTTYHKPCDVSKL